MGNLGAGAPLDSPATRYRQAATLACFAVLALAGNLFGATLRYPDIGSAVLFPPYAMLSAALLVSPRRQWVWYILAGSLAHFVTHWPAWPLTWVLFADVANVVRATTAALLLQTWVGHKVRLDSIRALCVFLFAAVLVAPAAGATIGAANVMVHGASATYWAPWRAWFVSNAITGLTMLPAFMTAFAYGVGLFHVRGVRRRALEVALLGVALAVTCTLAFAVGLDRQYVALPLYGSLPVLIWAAIRFGTAGASVALSVITAAAIFGVDRGTGPFLFDRADDNVLALQVFIICAALPVVCLATIATAREREVRLHRALMASLDDHVAILDADGLVLEVNHSWRRAAATADVPAFLHASVGDRYLARSSSPADGGDAKSGLVADAVVSVLAHERDRVEIEYERTRAGRLEAYGVTVEALERPEGGAVLTCANVSERRRARLEIEDQRHQLSHLSRVAAMGQLSGALAHEIYQPLSALMINAAAARQILDREPIPREPLRQILEDITADDQRAFAVVERLRAMLKRDDSRFEDVAVGDIVGDVLKLTKGELLSRGVEVSVAIDPALPPIRGDKVQLQQVLLNLVMNGCDAMRSAPAAGRRLEVAAGPDGSTSAHLWVRDAGTGIPEDLLGRLFTPFVTTKPTGLGLGLSICRTIVESHGGRLWAENNDGTRGATLHCLIPVSERAYAATARSAAIR